MFTIQANIQDPDRTYMRRWENIAPVAFETKQMAESYIDHYLKHWDKKYLKIVPSN